MVSAVLPMSHNIKSLFEKFTVANVGFSNKIIWRYYCCIYPSYDPEMVEYQRNVDKISEIYQGI